MTLYRTAGIGRALQPDIEMHHSFSVKRHRENVLSTIDLSATLSELLRQLQSALSAPQRLPVLREMQHLFLHSHGLESIRDTGTTNVLLLQLNQVLQHPRPVSIPVVHELCRTLLAFIRLYPGDTSMPILGSVIDEGTERTIHLLSSVVKLGVVDEVLPILHIISTHPTGARYMVLSKDLMEVLTDSLANGALSEANLHEGLGCLKNITCFADNHCYQMLQQSHTRGNLCALTRIIQSDKSLERLSAIFRNLSVSPKCRPVMTREPDFLCALFSFSNYHSNKPVLRNLLNTLVSLVMDRSACVILLFYEDGKALRLAKTWLHNEDVMIRKRSIRLLRMFADETSAILLLKDTDMIVALSNCAMQDESQAVRIEATEAFARCAGLVESRQPHYHVVLSALLSLTKCPNVPVEVVARALRQQTSQLDNRASIGNCTELIDTISNIASAHASSARTREDLCIALLDLTYEKENMERLASPNVLQALIDNATIVRSPQQKAAIQALIRLAGCSSNRMKMVNHHCLLHSLIQLATKATDSGLKSQIKMVILSLVGEL